MPIPETTSAESFARFLGGKLVRVGEGKAWREVNAWITSLLRPDQLKRMRRYMLDENEFLSPYGIRAVWRFHQDHPLILNVRGQEHRLDYEPG